MRTTVTLDPDVESSLRKEMHRRGEPFKQVLNDAIRTGLRAMRRHNRTFEAVTFEMGQPRVASDGRCRHNQWLHFRRDVQSGVHNFSVPVSTQP